MNRLAWPTALACCALPALLLTGARPQPRGFDPVPQLIQADSLRDRVTRHRLTVVFAPARPGCSSCIMPPVEALRRFVASYPEAHVVTALQPGLRVGRDTLVGGDRLDLKGPTGPRFAGQDLGVIAAFDGAGRTLLFRALTQASFDRLYDELETAYSLTAPRDSRWASRKEPR
jgi:hypothetical protein